MALLNSVPPALSPRQLDVLRQLAMPNKAIARRLKISRQTVKNHVAAIHLVVAVLSVRPCQDRTTALLWAMRAGIVSLDEAWSAVCLATGRTPDRLHGRRLHGQQIFATKRVGGSCTGGLWRCRSWRCRADRGAKRRYVGSLS